MTREVIYSMMVSLDGFIEGPNHEIDWIIVDEELHSYINDQQHMIDTYLYGRRMYELMAEYWPTADTDPSNPQYVVDFAHIWKAMPKVVFPRTLNIAEWGSRLVKDDVRDEVMRLKARSGKSLAVGGAAIASTLMRLGLIDEFHLFVHPVILGSGTPMFTWQETKISLQLIDVRQFHSGVVLLRYRSTELKQ